MVRGALSGVRIVEFGQLIAIPFATKLLADMGAEVIRIESCTRVELYRASGFYDNDPSANTGTGRSTSTSRIETSRA